MSDTTTVDNDLLDRHAPQIGPAPVALYLLLRRLATQEGDSLVVVGYSHEELSERLKVAPNSLAVYLEILSKRRLIEVRAPAVPARGRCSSYLISEPRTVYSVDSEN